MSQQKKLGRPIKYDDEYHRIIREKNREKKMKQRKEQNQICLD